MTDTDPRSAIERAAVALRRGDPLTAMSLTDRSSAAVALAIRGAALAQLDEPAEAIRCLTGAVAASVKQGDRDTRGRAALALAEIHLARRAFDEAERCLAACRAELGEGGANRALVAALGARLELYRGRPDEAARLASAVEAADAFGAAILALAGGEAELARGRVDRCLARVDEARRLAVASRHGFLLAEIEAGRERLSAPAARVVDGAGAREASVLDLAELRVRNDATVVDELLRTVRAPSGEARLVTRPLLFALCVRLAASHPSPVDRDELVLALGVRKSNEAHRATLRVELGRLRDVLPDGVAIVAAGTGFRIDLPAPLVRIAPLAGEPTSDVAALLSDGQAWRADDVAQALGASPRSAQRHLAALREDGVVRTVGAGRAARWILEKERSFTLLGQLSALWAAGAHAGPREDRATDVARAT